MIFIPGRTQVLVSSPGVQVSRPRGNHPLLALLTAYWKLDEASGNATGHVGGFTLTDNNTVGNASGLLYPTARDFIPGNSEYLSVASNTTLRTGDIDFSFNLWAYFNSTAGTFTMLSKWGAIGEYLIDNNSSGNVRFVVRNSANTAFVNTPNAAVSTGAWTMITAWHDATNNILGIAVNAGTAQTTSHSGGVNLATQAFELGRSGASSYFDGRLSGVGFWKNYVLTAADRTFLYNGGLGVNLEQLAGG